MAGILLQNDFSTNTTEFTAQAGTWGVSGGELQNTASQGGGPDWGNRVFLSDTRTFTDFDLTVKVKKPSFNTQIIFRSGTTAGTGFGIQLRDTNNLRLESWGSANLSQVTSLTWATGTYYWVRIRVVGTRIRAKVWVDGAYEPDWAINTTSSLFTTGGIGFSAESASGTAIFSNLTVYDPNLRPKRRLVDPVSAGFNSGINLSGAEFNPNIAGSKDTNYTYYDNSEYTSIATYFPGAVIRLPVVISRLCPTIGTVDSTKGTELTDAMTLAGNNGLRVLLDLHDYGAKYISGTQRRIGSAEYSQANYVDDMEAIATYVKDHSALWGIGISNEPNNMPVATTSSNYNSTATWTLAANAACAAIKAIDPTLILTVCTDNYSGFQNLTSTYPTNPFTNCDYIEIHAYFDSDNSGAYSGANASLNGSGRDVFYAGDMLNTCAQWARSNNVNLIIGETGIPANDQGYITMLNDFYSVAQMNNDVIKSVFFWAKKTGWYVSATASDVTNNLQQGAVHNKFQGNNLP